MPNTYFNRICCVSFASISILLVILKVYLLYCRHLLRILLNSLYIWNSMHLARVEIKIYVLFKYICLFRINLRGCWIQFRGLFITCNRNVELPFSRLQMVLKFRKRRTLSGGVIEAVCDDVWMQKPTAVCNCRNDELISRDRSGKSHHLIYIR